MANNKTRRRAAAFADEFLARRNPEKAAHLMRFFRTGPGQYGEGDRFLGLPVPATRALVKAHRADLTLEDADVLLDSEWHEIRLAALLLMVDIAKRRCRSGDVSGVEDVVWQYDRRLDQANNWDLVDLSAYAITGAFWRSRPAEFLGRVAFLERWAGSGKLWRERAAIVSTFATIRLGSLGETFHFAERFMDHSHDLIHKATGWMLREAGKSDIDALRLFLGRFAWRLPRTALRYAIEKMDPDERRRWMEAKEEE